MAALPSLSAYQVALDNDILLGCYELDDAKSDSVTQSTLKQMLKDIRHALEEHQRLVIYIEKAAD